MMDEKTLDKFKLFRSVMEYFVTFSDDEWNVVQSHLRLATLKKKAFFVEYGNVCEDIGLIVSGSMRYFQHKDGSEITGYFSIENEFVTSYKSFVTQMPANHFIQAIEDTELVLLSFDSLQQLYNHKLLSYKMERFGRLIAEYLICCYDDRLNSFIIQSPEERYLDLLSSRPDIIQRIPQHHIANFLGITPVSLSRIRRRVMKSAKKLPG